MLTVLPILMADAYKISHREQYPKKTQMVYSNWTARGTRRKDVSETVFFGLQYYIKEFLINKWNEEFFWIPKKTVLSRYERRIKNCLGGKPSVAHVEQLHDLQYLPLEIRALPEGTLVPLRVPMFTIHNTHPDFFWLTNALETQSSAELWMPCTSATTAFQYLRNFHKYARLTGANVDFIPWQGHDFSYRGMPGFNAAMASGAGHLLCFTGTDTIPAIDWLEEYYNANSDKELIGGSVPATEHSVMCVGGQTDEIGLIKRLITEVYPTGIVSIVSDTWDYWKVITEYLPLLKDVIMSRDGKVVARPDSGDPVKIICGDPDAIIGTPESKGSVECLWEAFGGTVNSEGFKTLDQHIGLIYGDAITLERQERILYTLAAAGFASDNIVLGIGSYTYQYVTRDTDGFALKTTAAVVDDKFMQVFKTPKTDNGLKKSAKGGIRVLKENGKLVLKDQFDNIDQVPENEHKTVYKDGVLLVDWSLNQIRQLIKEQL
jgi:nicotinamide phosphoribosyltransferase